jgi:prophage maintenance system killer protein
VGKKTIHHMDFDTLVDVNRQVVLLTGEPHAYSEADREKLASLATDVVSRADNQDFEEAVADKAALLIYKLASGQYFRAGNKRTALVAGLSFLLKNSYTLDIENAGLVETVDKAGIAAADLDDLYGVMKRLVTKGKTERRSWDHVVNGVVQDNREFLTKLGS